MSLPPNSYWGAESLESKAAVDALLATNSQFEQENPGNAGPGGSGEGHAGSSNGSPTSDARSNNQGDDHHHRHHHDDPEQHEVSVHQQMHLSNVTSPIDMDVDGPNGSRSGRSLNTSKRAQQNRQAQRAFRQRKEMYIKDLEAKVNELTATKETIESLRQENLQLRDYILALQSRLIEHPGGFPTPPAVYSRQGALTGSGGSNGNAGAGGSGEGIEGGSHDAETGDHQQADDGQGQNDQHAQNQHNFYGHASNQQHHSLGNIQLQALSNAALDAKMDKYKREVL